MINSIMKNRNVYSFCPEADVKDFNPKLIEHMPQDLQLHSDKQIEMPSGETIQIHNDPVIYVPKELVEESQLIDRTGFVRTINAAAPMGSDGVVRVRDHYKSWPGVDTSIDDCYLEEIVEESVHDIPIVLGSKVMNPSFYATEILKTGGIIEGIPEKHQSAHVASFGIDQNDFTRSSQIPIAPLAKHFWLVNAQEENDIAIKLETPLEAFHIVRPIEYPVFVIETGVRRPMCLASPKWHVYREPPKEGRKPHEQATAVEFIRYEIEECIVEKAWRLPDTTLPYEKIMFAPCYSLQMTHMLNTLFDGYRVGAGLPPLPKQITNPNVKLMKQLAFPSNVATATFGLGDDMLLVLADTVDGVQVWIHDFISDDVIYSSHHELRKNSLTKLWTVNQSKEALPTMEKPFCETPVDAFFVNAEAWMVKRSESSLPERFMYITGLYLHEIPRKFMGFTTMAIAVQGMINGIHYVRLEDQLWRMARSVSVGLNQEYTGGYEQYLMLNGCSESLCNRIMGKMAFVIMKLLPMSEVYACKNCYFEVIHEGEVYYLQPPAFRDLNWILSGHPGIMINEEYRRIWFC
jgi:hypothetical protein